jgi:hypothetical protein
VQQAKSAQKIAHDPQKRVELVESRARPFQINFVGVSPAALMRSQLADYSGSIGRIRFR